MKWAKTTQQPNIKTCQILWLTFGDHVATLLFNYYFKIKIKQLHGRSWGQCVKSKFLLCGYF